MKKASTSNFPRCQVSNDLIWEMTRNSSCFLVRNDSNNGAAFSRDPLNLTGLNSKRDSGLSGSGAFGITTETVNRKVIHKKVKKTAPVLKFRLTVKTRRLLPKKRCVQIKDEPTNNNTLYSNSSRLTARSVAKVNNMLTII